jgi:glycosyltransferase involved in cell wall biosynthesis
MPLVSVIIPAYNQGKYVGEAIQSVLGQSFRDFEIIVINDGSTDETSQVAKSFSDARLRYIFQENQGLSAARNTGIRNSKGVYITYLDADDLFTPTKLAVLTQILEAEPDMGLVAGQAVPIDEKGNRIGRIFDKPVPMDQRELLLSNPLHVGSVMLRMSWQKKVGYFDESLRSYEDWDMWLRLAKMGCKMGWVSKPVSFYRFHTNQMIRNSRQMTEATFAVLDKLFNDPYLTPDWLEFKNLAYSGANMRAAVQAYNSGNISEGKMYISNAVQLNPKLLDHNGFLLANRLAAFANSPKHSKPVKFLEKIYKNVPEDLLVLQKRKRHDLSKAAIELAFEADQNNDLDAARAAVLSAISYHPKWAMNRGVLSIIARSIPKIFLQV